MDIIISVTGLNKTYPSGNVALTGVDLDIRSGEILALAGPERGWQDHADFHDLRADRADLWPDHRRRL